MNISYKIGVVVVFYNNSLLDYRKKLISYIDEVCYVCIVDNSDKLYNNKHVRNVGLQAYDYKIELCIFHENKGIAYALNYGIEKCKDKGCDFVMTLDQDSFFMNNFSFQSIQNVDTNGLVLFYPRYLVNGKYEECDTIWQSGMILDTRLYERIGIFCEKYFIDYVDYDYLERIKKNGILLKNLPDIILVHNPGEKFSRLLFGIFKVEYVSISPIRYYYVMRNGLDFLIRYKKYTETFNLLKYLGKILIQEKEKRIRLYYATLGIQHFFKNIYGKCPINK